MAEIRIEKKNNSWLPWLLGLLVLLLIGWVAFELSDDDDDMDNLTTDTEKVDSPRYDENDTDYQDDQSATSAKVKPVNLKNFDKNWDGTNENFDQNYLYYLSSLEMLDAEMGLDHDYSNIALRALTNSLIALTNEQGLSGDVSINGKAKMMREKAQGITENWRSTDHADMIKKAAVAAADLMQEIQKRKFPDLENEVMEVKKEAQQIQPGTLTLDQKENVKSFFSSASDVLDQMRDN